MDDIPDPEEGSCECMYGDEGWCLIQYGGVHWDMCNFQEPDDTFANIGFNGRYEEEIKRLRDLTGNQKKVRSITVG